VKGTICKHLLRLLAGLVTGAFYAATIHKGESVTLAWDASPSSNVAGYVLYSRQSGVAFGSGENVGDNRTASVSNLVDGVTYAFAVSAYNSAGTESDLSNELSYSPPPTVATNLPVAATLAATEITAVSATLGGLVNPQGAATWAWFQYGGDTNYAGFTSPRSLGSGTSALALNNPVSGFVPGAFYHFRVVATNTLGVALGSDMTFTTPAMAPTVATQPATSITAKGAALNATIDPNGTATTAYFEYGPSSAYGSRTPLMSLGTGTNTLPISSSVGGLSAGFTYHFRIIASNPGGTVLGADSTFATSSRHIAKK